MSFRDRNSQKSGSNHQTTCIANHNTPAQKQRLSGKANIMPSKKAIASQSKSMPRLSRQRFSSRFKSTRHHREMERRD